MSGAAVIRSHGSVKLISLVSGEALVVYLENPSSDGETKLSLCDGENVWHCNVTDESLQSIADDMGQTIKVYKENFQRALCHEDDKENPLKYSLKETGDGNRWILSYSRHLPQDSIIILLGKVMVELATEEPKTRMMGFLGLLVSQQTQLNERNKSLDIHLENERALAADAMQKLTMFVTEHEKNESELYANFVDVLNEKKRKLRELRDECNVLRSELATSKLSRGATPAEPISSEPRKTRGGKPASRTPRGGGAVRQRKRKSYKYASSGSATEEDEMAAGQQGQARRLESSDSDGTEFDEVAGTTPADTVAAKQNTVTVDVEVPLVKPDPNKESGDTNELDNLLGEMSVKRQADKNSSLKRSPVKRRSRNVDSSQPSEHQEESQTQTSQRLSRSCATQAETTRPPTRRGNRGTTTRSQALIDDIMDEL